MNDSVNQQIVYILTNPCFPDWIKIGRCTNLEKRLKNLSSNTAIPLPFEVFYACTVEDSKVVESKLFHIFSKDRITPSREFFCSDPEQVVKVLDLFKITEVVVESEHRTQDDLRAGEIIILNESKFLFSSAGISLGSTIYMTRKPEIVATVVDQHAVVYDEKKWDFTELTKFLIQSKFKHKSLKISAPRYWSHAGEMLVALKDRKASV